MLSGPPRQGPAPSSPLACMLCVTPVLSGFERNVAVFKAGPQTGDGFFE